MADNNPFAAPRVDIAGPIQSLMQQYQAARAQAATRDTIQKIMSGQVDPTRAIMGLAQTNPVAAAGVTKLLGGLQPTTEFKTLKSPLTGEESLVGIEQQPFGGQPKITPYNVPGMGGIGGGQGSPGPADTADAIMKGLQPPTTQGLYRQGPMVRDILGAKGFDLSDAQLQWERAQTQTKKQVSSLNSPQMVRYVGLTDSVIKTIDEVNGLAQQMKQSGVIPLNRAKLEYFTQVRGNTPEGQLATRYLTATNTLKEEFANLAQGGYAPTEPAWELANQQINANYGVDQLGSSLTEIQRLMRYRKQAIPGLEQYGPGTLPSYKAPGQTSPGQTDPNANLKPGELPISPTPTQQPHPDIPAPLQGKQGLQWSPSKQRWRDKDGNLYNQQGVPVGG